MAEKVSLKDPERSNPASNEFYDSETPRDLKIHQNAGDPEIPFIDSKINDSFDGGDNALLLDRNKSCPGENRIT